jgi:hypothetical protein
VRENDLAFAFGYHRLMKRPAPHGKVNARQSGSRFELLGIWGARQYEVARGCLAKKFVPGLLVAVEKYREELPAPPLYRGTSRCIATPALIQVSVLTDVSVSKTLEIGADGEVVVGLRPLYVFSGV